MSGKVGEVGPGLLELVPTRQQQRQWRGWGERYHYLGCKVPFGARLRYFVRTARSQPQLVGYLQVSSPAWRMAPRDQRIGRDDTERLRGLERIVQNSRLLILPWVRFDCPVGSALSALARRVADDWEARYVVKPVLIETAVDPSRFRGTGYRAADGIYLGRTSGRGRFDRGALASRGFSQRRAGSTRFRNPASSFSAPVSRRPYRGSMSRCFGKGAPFAPDAVKLCCGLQCESARPALFKARFP